MPPGASAPRRPWPEPSRRTGPLLSAEVSAFRASCAGLVITHAGRLTSPGDHTRCRCASRHTPSAVVWAGVRRLLCIVLLTSGCSCDEDADIRADGFVRCHLVEAPEAREWTYRDLRLRIEGRALSIEGLPETYRIAAAAGPASADAPEAQILVLVGDADPTLPDTEGLTLLLAGGADDWAEWRQRFAGIEGDTRLGIIDVTALRTIRAGPVELVFVPGAPNGRYARTDGCCGVDDAEPWELGAAEPGVHRVLVSWAAPEAAGLLGLPAGSEVISEVRDQVGAESVIFAWPRLDPRALRPARGAWVSRSDGSREPPGWDLYEASADGLRSVMDSP